MNVLTKYYVPIFFMVLVLVGCGAFHGKVGSSPSEIQRSLFLTNVRPILSSNCFSCHATPTNAGGAAFFMSQTDSVQLYEESSKKIIIGEINGSLLVQKGSGNGHGGGNQLTRIEDQEKIKNWIMNVQSDTETTTTTIPIPMSPLLLTEIKPVPSNLTLQGDYQYVRFDLTSLGHSGAFIEMGIKLYNEGGYEFSQWRVYSPNYPLKITGINVAVINGSSQIISSTLARLAFSFVKSTPPASVAPPLVVALETNRGDRAATGSVVNNQDQVKLGFTLIENADSAAVRERANFFTSVKPLLLNNCSSCHGNTNGAGNFNMPNNDDVILYQNVFSRVVKQNVTASSLYNKGTGTVAHGGGNRLPLQTEKDIIINWINMIN